MFHYFFMCLFLIKVGTSSFVYVQSREGYNELMMKKMTRMNKSAVIEDGSIENPFRNVKNALISGNRNLYLMNGTHGPIDLRYVSNVQIRGNLDGTVVSGGVEIPPSKFELNSRLTKIANKTVIHGEKHFNARD